MRSNAPSNKWHELVILWCNFMQKSTCLRLQRVKMITKWNHPLDPLWPPRNPKTELFNLNLKKGPKKNESGRKDIDLSTPKQTMPVSPPWSDLHVFRDREFAFGKGKKYLSKIFENKRCPVKVNFNGNTIFTPDIS